PRLFELNGIITLDGSSDVLTQNPQFNQFLDSKRVYAKTALESCRDLADTVWTEFKRNALIKISQAQDEKIEEVKMSCVSTMKDCYDTQSGALKSFDDTTAQASGALAARASRAMCADKVEACAALYRTGSEAKCQVDTTTNRIKNASACGLGALINFVDTVDEVRVAEGCSTAVENYLKQLCTPSSGEEGYPWNCRLRSFGNAASLTDANNWMYKPNDNSNIFQMVINYAFENCGEKTGENKYTLEARAKNDIVLQMQNLQEDMVMIMGEKCESLDGLWENYGIINPQIQRLNAPHLKKFYSDNFGGRDDATTTSLGTCYENATMTACLAYNSDDEKLSNMASYDAARDMCVFSDKWYEQQCALLGSGYFENGVCYVAQ
ncbi:MAG: hypothetical protein II843_00250, partial [Alphaproteobacteria bacterium]|nr:hypothetical protein [Alphaproteobacteria bacterium]